MNDLLEDTFLDIADKIGRVLTEEFNKRYHPPAFFFNAGYLYSDFLGRIFSNEHGQFSKEDIKLAMKIIDREIKKLGSAETFTLRLYTIEYESSPYRSSLTDSKTHILHHWTMTLMAGFLKD